MRKYKIYPKGLGNANSMSPVAVEADDVDLETADGPMTAFWNFTVQDGDDPITVAAFPFADVAFVVSEEEQ